MEPEVATQELLEELQALLDEREEEALRIFLRLARPEDVAGWLDHLTPAQRQRIFGIVDDRAAGTILADTVSAIRDELVEALPPAQLARIVDTMPLDEAADLLGELEPEVSDRVLIHLRAKKRHTLRVLMGYPEDTAGGIMNPAVVALEGSTSVDEAIGAIRHVGENTITSAVYVVDAERRLLGFVRLRRLVTAAPGSLLENIMEADVISVGVKADQEQVADLVEKYDFYAIPVVDDGGRLLGAVTVDDVLDVIEEEATEDIYRLAGSFAEEEEAESVLHVARYRLPWLLICLGGTQLSTTVMQSFSHTMPLYEQISIFTPAIMAMGGNTSLQSSTTTVRRLALDTLPRARYLGHVWREVMVALVVGAACGAVETAAALVFRQGPLLGLAVGVAMALGMSAASLLGGAMPLILDLLGVDPAVASGPLVSTINDSLGLAIYFTVAAAILLSAA